MSIWDLTKQPPFSTLTAFIAQHYLWLLPLNFFLGTWFLFSKRYFPLPLARYVGRFLFLPTSPPTIIAHTLLKSKYGAWYDQVDDKVFLGAMPLRFSPLIPNLYGRGVRAIVNLCDEYLGPVSLYKKLGIQQLYLPTVDHFEPSVEDMQRAVEFMKEAVKRGDSVYVHCRAGHGRSAAVAMAWLLSKYKYTPMEAQKYLLERRSAIRKNLYNQPNVLSYYESCKRAL